MRQPGRAAPRRRRRHVSAWLPSPLLRQYVQRGCHDPGTVEPVERAQVALTTDRTREPCPQSDAPKRLRKDSRLEQVFRNRTTESTLDAMLLKRQETARLASCRLQCRGVEGLRGMNAQNSRLDTVASRQLFRCLQRDLEDAAGRRDGEVRPLTYAACHADLEGVVRAMR